MSPVVLRGTSVAARSGHGTRCGRPAGHRVCGSRRANLSRVGAALAQCGDGPCAAARLGRSRRRPARTGAGPSPGRATATAGWDRRVDPDRPAARPAGLGAALRAGPVAAAGLAPRRRPSSQTRALRRAPASCGQPGEPCPSARDENVLRTAVLVIHIPCQADVPGTKRLTRRHCTAVLHGVRGLDATIAGDSWDAICAVALTNPETLARELRLRAEAISPALAGHAGQRLEDRIGLSCSDRPDGAGHLTATLAPETVALRNAVLDRTVQEPGPTAAPAAPPGEVTARSTTCSDTPRTAPSWPHQAKVAAGPRTPSSPPLPPCPAPPRPGSSALPTAYSPAGVPADAVRRRHQYRSLKPGTRTARTEPADHNGQPHPTAGADRQRPALRRHRLPPPTSATPNPPWAFTGPTPTHQPGQPHAALPHPPPPAPPPTTLASLHRQPDPHPSQLARRPHRQPPTETGQATGPPR